MANEIQNTKSGEVTKSQKAAPTVMASLEAMKGQFDLVLPKHITPERMVRIALNAIQNTPKLAECDQKSFLGAIMRSAQLGLEPDGVRGQAYRIPVWNNRKKQDEAQFIVGYKGLIDLARRSGEVSNIIAKEVYENDEFTVDWAGEIPFSHKPLMSGDRGEVTHFWALARFKDGGFHWDYMTRAEVEKVRDSGNGKNKVWTDHFLEMGKKTVIRRIAKYLPMSVQKATISEDITDAGKSVSFDAMGEVMVDGEYSQVVENDTAATGNEGVKQKLAKANDAGADPDTGEIKQDTPAEKTEPDNVPPALRGMEEEKPQADSAELTDMIPIPPHKGDSSKQDIVAWANLFAERCRGMKKVFNLSALYSNNVRVLNQIETSHPEEYRLCEDAYADAAERINSHSQEAP